MNENEKKQRIGNQKPTVSHTLEYQKTDAETAINLYEQTGKTVQKWQSQLLYDILAKNDDIANSEDSGIIKLESDNKSLYKEQNYSDRKIELPNYLKESISALKNSGDYLVSEKNSFSMQDLSILSKETGVEFASITVGDKSILIRGSNSGTDIPETIIEEIRKNKGTLDFHSHPHNGDNVPSASDREAIGLLESITGQNTSKIVTTDGKVTVFNKYGVINVETVDNTMSDEYKKCLKNFLEVNKYVVYW